MGAAFEGLNAIIMNVFFIECRGQCLIVKHTIFFKQSRVEKVTEKMLIVCFFSYGFRTQWKLKKK